MNRDGSDVLEERNDHWRAVGLRNCDGCFWCGGLCCFQRHLGGLGLGGLGLMASLVTWGGKKEKTKLNFYIRLILWSIEGFGQ